VKGKLVEGGGSKDRLVLSDAGPFGEGRDGDIPVFVRGFFLLPDVTPLPVYLSWERDRARTTYLRLAFFFLNFSSREKRKKGSKW